MDSKNYTGLHVLHQPQPSDSSIPVSDARARSCPSSNLHCFLQQTTPIVPIHLLSQSCLRGSSASQRPEGHFYFFLCDLWESFNEWSAYGAGVPILVKGKEAVTQYFVPYLSAVQLYSSSSNEHVNSRRLGDDSDDLSELDFRSCSSELSADSEGEKTWDCGCGGPDEPCSPTSIADSRDECNSESLLFQYFESKIPSVRVPLYESIKELSKRFPALQKLCSNNLSHSSWMSVAWYPIYRIPTGVTLSHFATCFLTYHALSTCFTDDRGLEMHAKATECVRHLRLGNHVALEPFGLASYKLKDTIWTSSTQEANCKHLMRQLQEGAHTWVKQLNVSHPDLEYFLSQGARL